MSAMLRLAFAPIALVLCLLGMIPSSAMADSIRSQANGKWLYANSDGLLIAGLTQQQRNSNVNAARASEFEFVRLAVGNNRALNQVAIRHKSTGRYIVRRSAGGGPLALGTRQINNALRFKVTTISGRFSVLKVVDGGNNYVGIGQGSDPIVVTTAREGDPSAKFTISRNTSHVARLERQAREEQQAQSRAQVQAAAEIMRQAQCTGLTTNPMRCSLSGLISALNEPFFSASYLKLGHNNGMSWIDYRIGGNQFLGIDLNNTIDRKPVDLRYSAVKLLFNDWRMSSAAASVPSNNRISVKFRMESAGVEMIAEGRVAGRWVDSVLPDIHYDNAQAQISIELANNDRKLQISRIQLDEVTGNFRVRTGLDVDRASALIRQKTSNVALGNASKWRSWSDKLEKVIKERFKVDALNLQVNQVGLNNGTLLLHWSPQRRN